MEKTAKVTNVQPTGGYEGKFGPMYNFNITFDNGDSGQYSSKKEQQDKFVVGNEATYTIEQNGKYTNIKPVYQQAGYSGGKKGGYNSPERLEFDREKFLFEKKKQIMIMQQSCMGYAIEILAAQGKEFNTAEVVELKNQLYANILSNLPK